MRTVRNHADAGGYNTGKIWIETRKGQIGLFCYPTGENLLPSWAANFSQLGRIYESFRIFLYTMFPSVRILRCIQSCLILRIGLVEDWNSSGQSKGDSLSKAIHVVAVWIGNPLFSFVYRRCRSVRAYEHVRFKTLFWQPLISRQTSRRLSRRCPWEAAAGPC